MPPCGVYQESGNGIPVTPTSYANRTRQISHLIQKVIKPDVIAFQEVSGSAAIREALGPTADEYHICSFDDKFKVQRLAFAWRKRFGDAAEACKVVESVSLPQEPAIQQVRPALTVGLRLEGKLIRFMTVHLKSSCVSSLEKARLDDESQEACVLLQKQIRPLETAVEGLSSGADHVVVLGDFNRNLWHEANEVLGSEAMRSDGERQLSRPLASGVQSRNLFREVFDGDPGGAMSLLPLSCTQEANNQTLCTESKMRVLTREEKAALAAPIALGCRYPIGLDHFVVSDSLQAKIILAEKLPIGQLGGSKLPVQGRPEPFLAVSDHCPIVFTFIP